MTVEQAAAPTHVFDETLTRRALQIVRDKTTEMADDVLRVPLRYYNDPKLTEIERISDSAAHTVGRDAQTQIASTQRLRGALGAR